MQLILNYQINGVETFIIDYQPGLLLGSRGRSPDNCGRGEAKQIPTRRTRTWILKIKQLSLPKMYVIFTTCIALAKCFPQAVFRSVSSGDVYRFPQ